MPTPALSTNPVPEGRRFVGIDTETFLIQPGLLAPQLVCVSTCEVGEPPRLFDHIEGIAVFKRLLEDETAVLVIANAPFDLGVACAEDPELMWLVIIALLQDRIVDVLTWQRLFLIKYGWSEFDPYLQVKISDGYFTLETMAKRWLGESVQGKHGDDVWRKRYAELFGIPIEQWPMEAKNYAAHDAELHLRVCLEQHSKEGILPDFWRKVRQSFALHLFAARGLRTCDSVVRELERDIHNNIDVKLRELLDDGVYKIGGTRKAPKLQKDTAEIKRRVVESCGRQNLAVPRTEASEKFPMGQVKTDREQLEMSDDEVLHKLAEVGADQTLLSTYLPVLLKGTVYPINPRYTVPVDTGRSSSSGPNIQNQPRKRGARECFVPRPGYIFVDCDYNIAESRSFAQVLLSLYGHSALAEAIKVGDAKGKGYDIHCVMAAKIMHIELDEFAERFKRGDKECKKTRGVAKPVDFGVPGGMTDPQTLVTVAKQMYGIIMTLAEAETYIAYFLELFPEVAQYLEDIGAQTGYGGTTDIIQLGSGRIRGRTRFNAACNTYWQGLVADGALEACWRVAVECYTGIIYRSDEHMLETLKGENIGDDSPLWGSYPVWFVHDQIGLESPFATARAAGKQLGKIMRESMNIFTPDVPSIADADMKRRWYKDAEAEYGDDGELVPWAPPNPRQVLLQKIEKAVDAVEARSAEVDENLYWGDEPWTDEQLADVEHLIPPPEKDPSYWKDLNKVWRWEMLARHTNPDPWC